MTTTRSRIAALLLVALTVGLAGCAGGGDATPTATPEPDGEGDGSDGDTGDDADDAGDDSDESTATATATSTPSATSTPTATATPTETGDSDSFSTDAHRDALRAAGSYTLEYDFEGLSAGTGASSLNGTERVDVDTGERYSTLTSRSEQGNFTVEYYVPPNADTGYQHGFGQTSEVPAGDAAFFNFTDIGTGEASEELPEFREAGTDETDLGSATVYVVDSVDELPESTRDQYDSVESVEFRVWIDDDTGAIARYDYDLTYVEDGEENTLEMRIELSDFGSTTVEAPEWVPEE